MLQRPKHFPSPVFCTLGSVSPTVDSLDHTQLSRTGPCPPPTRAQPDQKPLPSHPYRDLTVPCTRPNLQPNTLAPNGPQSHLSNSGFASRLRPTLAMPLGLFPRGLNRDEHSVTHLPGLTSEINERRNTTRVTRCSFALRRFSAQGSCHPNSTHLTSWLPSPSVSLTHTPPSDDYASGESFILPTSGSHLCFHPLL